MWKWIIRRLVSYVINSYELYKKSKFLQWEFDGKIDEFLSNNIIIGNIISKIAEIEYRKIKIQF